VTLIGPRRDGMPGPRVRRWLLAVASMLVVVLLLAPAARHRWQAHQRIQLGERLLAGNAGQGVAGDVAGALSGRLAGHPQALPAVATRCVNCHAIEGMAAPNGTAFGPLLGATTLTGVRSRRGGPASRYDADSLCRLLRDGIDPAWVMIDGAMPRYEIDASQCRALWARLARPSPG
jgi:cytochrome c553